MLDFLFFILICVSLRKSAVILPHSPRLWIWDVVLKSKIWLSDRNPKSEISSRSLDYLEEDS